MVTQDKQVKDMCKNGCPATNTSA